MKILMLSTFVCLHLFSTVHSEDYLGIYQGDLNGIHDVSGKVYIADDRTFIVKDFTYDGTAPDAYFWVGRTSVPDENGSIAPLESNPGILKKFTGKDVIVKLPENYQMSEVQSLSVWCRQFTVDFGNIVIDGSKVPQMKKIDTFPVDSAHQVAATEITIVDTKTIKVKNFVFDGLAPDAYFIVGKLPVTFQGTKVPIEGEDMMLSDQYTGKDLTLKLPGDLTVFDIEYLSVFCFQVSQNFGHVVLPDLRNAMIPVGMKQVMDPELACYTIKKEKMNVYWSRDDAVMVITLEGKVAEGEYLAFGISGSPTSPSMIGSDVVIAYVKNGVVIAEDYFLSSKSPCNGGQGVCKDQVGSDKVDVLNSEYSDGILRVSYRKPIYSSNTQDRSFSTVGTTSVIGAIGGVSDSGDIKFHNFFTKDPILIDVNSTEATCSSLNTAPEKNKYKGWKPSSISNQTVFQVQLGPTGGDKGYKAITGAAGWGIALFVNGMLIPELNVIRGKEYKFIIAAGNDKDVNAKYHPVYITTSPEGGSGAPGRPSPTDIVAGVTKISNGSFIPTAGNLCEWTPIGGNDTWKVQDSFEDYKKTLVLNCKDPEEPGTFTWTPDHTVPDIVYYQCWVHKNLGWKINVSSSSETRASLITVIFISIFLAIFK